MCLVKAPKKQKTPLELSGLALIETSPKTPAALPFGPILSLLMETNSGCYLLICMARANWWG
jgi:hypothetical protein